MEPVISAPAAHAGRAVVVDGAAPEVQAWMDALTDAARTGGPHWAGHGHDRLPGGRLHVTDLHRLIEEEFLVSGRAWSVERDGLPPVPDGRGGLPAGAAVPDLPPDPNSGSQYHNLLHRILGDFH